MSQFGISNWDKIFVARFVFRSVTTQRTILFARVAKVSVDLEHVFCLTRTLAPPVPLSQDAKRDARRGPTPILGGS